LALLLMEHGQAFDIAKGSTASTGKPALYLAYPALSTRQGAFSDILFIPSHFKHADYVRASFRPHGVSPRRPEIPVIGHW